MKHFKNVASLMLATTILFGCTKDGTSPPSTNNSNNNNTNTCTATIQFDNNSNNPYSVYIVGTNGTTTTDLPSKTTQTATEPLGSYSVRVTQLSGYLISPTIESYAVYLTTCNQNAIVSFP